VGRHYYPLDFLYAGDDGAGYYVDATAGNDANDGRSPGSPWQTIAKVNASTFQPGDSVLFKRGETWIGTGLVVPSSGVGGAPIVFGAYDAGANPIIDGNDLVNCIIANTKSHLRFENIECTQGLDFGFSLPTCDNITLVNCDAHDCGNDNLIFSTGCSYCTVQGGSFYNAYGRVGGTTNTGIEINDGCHDITIDGATCYGSAAAGQGIGILNHVATTFPYNVTVTNCTCRNNAQNGIYIYKADANVDADRNITVTDCTCYDNTLDGIYINKSGVAYVNGVAIDSCVSRSNDRRPLNLIGDNVTITRTALATDVNLLPVYIVDSKDVTFYNVTVYAAAIYTLFNGMITISGARMEDFVMKNCIVEAENTNPYMIDIAAGTGVVGFDIDYNLYGYTGVANRWGWVGVAKSWVTWLADTGMDANSPARADPAFTNPAANDWTLQVGSPAINAGVDVGLPYCGAAPDCGAYEYCP